MCAKHAKGKWNNQPHKIRYVSNCQFVQEVYACFRIYLKLTSGLWIFMAASWPNLPNLVTAILAAGKKYKPDEYKFSLCKPLSLSFMSIVFLPFSKMLEKQEVHCTIVLEPSTLVRTPCSGYLFLYRKLNVCYRHA
jgi:hypothetical protein